VVRVKIQLDRGSELPLGVQLAWHLRAAVAAGELGEGERLPSVREMAAASGVNANTVRAVYARLEAEGIVATEHGRGTFVKGSAGAGDGELAKIAQRAARAARDAGLDPRAVAAALFVSGEDAAPAKREGGEATRRRALRNEIAALERRLADARLQRRLAAHADDPIADPPPAAAPGRLLSATELASIRDDLAERLALLEDAERVSAEKPATTATTQHSTAPSAKVTLAPSAPRWRLGHS
jgi:DNA-binding transcriptional regulator YhcF (GntR family)